MNLYPEQMKALAAMCEALNAVDERAVQFKRIEVQDEHGQSLGYLVDEAGGAFSWAPPGWYDKK